ncbi:MAG TPA: helix-turn-helix domain-containing protein, partial [Segetibacter sp.]
HIEFIDKEHFEHKYFRVFAEDTLSMYIEFCWETRFGNLLDDVPQGFSDVLFPNIGYAYLINLGTPFRIELDNQTFDLKTSGFLPRHVPIIAHHSVGNTVFGIKFKVCPIVFEKDVDFSDYKLYIYPLAYLIDQRIIEKVRAAIDFTERSNIVFEPYEALIKKHKGLEYVTMITEILKGYNAENHFNLSNGQTAKQFNRSRRTLGRYCEKTTGFSAKQALRIIRMRTAVADFAHNPGGFDYSKYKYRDYNHFCKHLKQFTADHFHHFQNLHKSIDKEFNRIQ